MAPRESTFGQSLGCRKTLRCSLQPSVHNTSRNNRTGQNMAVVNLDALILKLWQQTEQTSSFELPLKRLKSNGSAFKILHIVCNKRSNENVEYHALKYNFWIWIRIKLLYIFTVLNLMSRLTLTDRCIITVMVQVVPVAYLVPYNIVKKCKTPRNYTDKNVQNHLPNAQT